MISDGVRAGELEVHVLRFEDVGPEVQESLVVAFVGVGGMHGDEGDRAADVFTSAEKEEKAPDEAGVDYAVLLFC